MGDTPGLRQLCCIYVGFGRSVFDLRNFTLKHVNRRQPRRFQVLNVIMMISTWCISRPELTDHTEGSSISILSNVILCKALN